jgi:hypothetical protein
MVMVKPALGYLDVVGATRSPLNCDTRIRLYRLKSRTGLGPFENNCQEHCLHLANPGDALNHNTPIVHHPPLHHHARCTMCPFDLLRANPSAGQREQVH